MPAGILDALIGERHDDGQAENFKSDAHPDIVPGDQGGHQDGEQQHDDQKAGAAARVEAGVFAHVLHRQLLAVLVAEDGLVLGAVVHKDAADVAHLGDGGKVADQDNHLDDTLQRGQRQRVLEEAAEEIDDGGRQEGEEKDGDDKRNHQDAPFQKGHEFVAQRIAQLLLKGGGFLLLVVQAGLFGGLHQALVAGGQRIDKVKDAADKGGALVPGAHAGGGPLLGGDGVVRQAHRQCGDLRPAHHDALDDRLSADGSFDGFLRILF